jgi:hypothetical protein
LAVDRALTPLKDNHFLRKCCPCEGVEQGSG